MLLFPLNLDFKKNEFVKFLKLINYICMGIVFIKGGGGSPLKYKKGVISNFENVSKYRRFHLKCSKNKSEMLNLLNQSYHYSFDAQYLLTPLMECCQT